MEVLCPPTGGVPLNCPHGGWGGRATHTCKRFSARAFEVAEQQGDGVGAGCGRGGGGCLHPLAPPSHSTHRLGPRPPFVVRPGSDCPPGTLSSAEQSLLLSCRQRLVAGPQGALVPRTNTTQQVKGRGEGVQTHGGPPNGRLGDEQTSQSNCCCTVTILLFVFSFKYSEIPYFFLRSLDFPGDGNVCKGSRGLHTPVPAEFPGGRRWAWREWKDVALSECHLFKTGIGCLRNAGPAGEVTASIRGAAAALATFGGRSSEPDANLQEVCARSVSLTVSQETRGGVGR